MFVLVWFSSVACSCLWQVEWKEFKNEMGSWRPFVRGELTRFGKREKRDLDSRIIDGERIFLIAIRRSNGRIKNYQIEKENGTVIYKEACNIFKGYLNEGKIQEIVRQNFKDNEGEL